MSEARTPEEQTLATGDADDEPESEPDECHGPDPEADPKGDGSDEDQGT